MKAPASASRAPRLMATGTIRSARTGAPVARFAAVPKPKAKAPKGKGKGRG